ncbi:MAG TPA: acyltransferase family protein, partial [Acidimicrobiales bacterium]|nr:acyltransferase family protein [Acidimicrobiales bacterium]
MTDTTLVREQAGAPAAPTAVTGRHLPALNGLRGVAVIGVVAYHLQIGWAKGGYLGVDLFFVLSGFLITTLLLEEWTGTGRVNLAAFWGRRAKRLLPALFLVVAALALYLVCNALFGGPGANALIDLPGLRGDAIASLLYVNNWHLIFAHQSYFAQFSTPSPLQHTWSLAIEEQFYLVWPLLLLVLLKFGRRGWRRLGVTVTVVLGVGSSVLMAVLFNPAVDPSRIYYGTDTRLFDLMAGATIAFLAASRGQPGAGARRALHWVGPAAAVVLAAFWVRAGTPGGLPTNVMFEGGFLLCAALAGLIVADARLVEPGWFARGLAWRPLHFVGTISYGVYLWHWPVIVYLTGARTGLSTWPLNLLRIAVTLLVSTASYYLVERPIRLAKLRGSMRFWLGPVVGVITAVVIVVATVPSVADPAKVVGTTHLASSGSVQTVPGAGGFAGQQHIELAAAPSAADPLRVMILGDSVMHDASYGITASLEATGEATVATRTIDGFGLVRASDWPTSIPNLIKDTQAQLIVASWSWDQSGPATPNALHQPVQYANLLHRAVATMLAPGNGVEGVIFTEFPPSGDIAAADPANQVTYNKQREAGVKAWNDIAEKMASE